MKPLDLPRGRQRGFALLIVLWALVLITLITTQVTGSGHSETLIAANLRSAARLRALADGEIQEAAFHLMDTSPAGWRAGGEDHAFVSQGVSVRIHIADDDGKVNPSTATPELLQALMRQVGISNGTVPTLAAAIVAWRTPSGDTGIGSARFASYRAEQHTYGPSGAPFLSISELGAVIGMTPQYLRSLAPHLSLFTEGDPDFTLADPQVRQALTVAGAGAFARRLDKGEVRVVTVTASVAAAGGEGFVRRATLRLTRNGGRPDFRILSWESPAG